MARRSIAHDADIVPLATHPRANGAFVRHTRWFIAAALSLATGLLAIYVRVLASRFEGGTSAGPVGPVLGGDFAQFWTASAAVRAGGVGNLLDAEIYRSFAPVDAPSPWYRWVYFPTSLLLFYPLASLPYIQSLVAWSVAGIASYLGTAYVILRRPATLVAAVAFPGLFITLLNGQLGLFVFAMFGLGLLLLPGRSAWAGVLLGTMCVKPQHAWLVPVALAAGRYWVPFAAGTVTLVASIVAATAFFGTSAWGGVPDSVANASNLIRTGIVPHHLYVSAFGAARLAGTNAQTAYAVQIVAAAAAMTSVVFVWRRRTAPFELKAAVLVTATLFGNYYILHYDLVLLGLAVAFAARIRPWSSRAIVVMSLAWGLPLFAALLAKATRVQVAPVVLGCMLFTFVRRAIGQTHQRQTMRPRSG